LLVLSCLIIILLEGKGERESNLKVSGLTEMA
jgi:hypothetical protein